MGPLLIPLRQPPARVVFLLEELNFGGTQRQTLELARRLDRSRYQAEIWLLRGGADLLPLAQRWGLPAVWLSQGPRVGPAALGNLWRRLRTRQVDLFLTLTAIPNIWGRLLGKWAGLPRIVGNVRSNTAHRQHERWLWPLADHLICNNQALELILREQYDIARHRLSLIPNGVDTDYFQPSPAGRDPENLTVLSIGRLVPDKDQETLIRAFRLVLDNFPAARLWLVGDGPRRPCLERLMQELLPPSRAQLFSGQEDIRPFLAQADLFVLSSVTEALPNVVLEAMAAGLPVVATQVGGLPDAVIPGETGWLTPPRQPARLGAAMAVLLADVDRRRTLGEAGRARAVREFSLPVMVRRYEALFEALLAPRKGK